MTNGMRVLLCGTALLAACARAYSPAVAPVTLSQPVDVAAIDEAIASAAMKAPPVLRMLVRRAQMGVEVERLDPAEERVTSMTKSLGGWVEEQSSRMGGFNDGRRLTVRVPAPQLDAAMDSVGRLGRVTSRNVQAEDVTDNVVDLDARATSLRGTRDRLRQLIDRSASVADVVAVEKELGRVQAELDVLDARLAQLRGQVAMSALAVDLREKHVLGPLGLAVAGVGWIFQKLFFLR